MQLQRGSNISLEQSQHSNVTTSKVTTGGNSCGSLWITDCVLMNNCNKLVVATTSNELLFLDMSTMLCHCQHRIVGQFMCYIVYVMVCVTLYIVYVMVYVALYIVYVMVCVELCT